MKYVLFEILGEISERKGHSINRYDHSASLRRDLGFDSFDLAELTVKLEDQTGIDIFEGSLMVDTIEEILMILQNRRVG